MSLKSKFREAQANADRNFPSNLAGAFGLLEKAVAEYLGAECKCPDCGGVNRKDGQRCEWCEKRWRKLTGTRAKQNT